MWGDFLFTALNNFQQQRLYYIKGSGTFSEVLADIKVMFALAEDCAKPFITTNILGVKSCFSCFEINNQKQVTVTGRLLYVLH